LGFPSFNPSYKTKNSKRTLTPRRLGWA